jgi:hypothetical protein
MLQGDAPDSQHRYAYDLHLLMAEIDATLDVLER